jgi:hypothetical protein
MCDVTVLPTCSFRQAEYCYGGAPQQNGINNHQRYLVHYLQHRDINHHLKKKCAHINDSGSLKSYQRKTAQISL